jgi:hypothetical protein
MKLQTYKEITISKFNTYNILLKPIQEDELKYYTNNSIITCSNFKKYVKSLNKDETIHLIQKLVLEVFNQQHTFTMPADYDTITNTCGTKNINDKNIITLTTGANAIKYLFYLIGCIGNPKCFTIIKDYVIKR